MITLHCSDLSAGSQFLKSICSLVCGCLMLAMVDAASAAEPIPKSNGWKIPKDGFPMAISPEGKYAVFSEMSFQSGEPEYSFVIGNIQEGTIVLENWDEAMKKVRYTDLFFMWGPNGDFSYWDGTAVKVYSLEKKALLATVTAGYRASPQSKLECMAQGTFMRDGKRIILAQITPSQQLLEIWDYTQQKLVKAIDAAEMRAFDFVVAPNDKELFQISSQDGAYIVACRNLDSDQVIRSQSLPQNWFKTTPQVQLAPNGKYLALSDGSQIKVIRTEDFVLQSSIGPEQGLEKPPTANFNYFFTADGQRLVTATWGLPVWNVESGKLEGILAHPSYHASRVVLSAGGELVGSFERANKRLGWFRLTDLQAVPDVTKFNETLASQRPQMGLPTAAPNGAATKTVPALPSSGTGAAIALSGTAATLTDSTVLAVTPRSGGIANSSSKANMTAVPAEPKARDGKADAEGYRTVIADTNVTMVTIDGNDQKLPLTVDIVTPDKLTIFRDQRQAAYQVPDLVKVNLNKEKGKIAVVIRYAHVGKDGSLMPLQVPKLNNEAVFATSHSGFQNVLETNHKEKGLIGYFLLGSGTFTFIWLVDHKEGTLPLTFNGATLTIKLAKGAK